MFDAPHKGKEQVQKQFHSGVSDMVSLDEAVAVEHFATAAVMLMVPGHRNEFLPECWCPFQSHLSKVLKLLVDEMKTRARAMLLKIHLENLGVKFFRAQME